tara:strand:- start:314 stop:439 length:126 start_codon:yes stop_codon:yes gene_type:complete
MIKKISIILILSLMTVSCGKKGCPHYLNDETKECNPMFKKK